MSNGMRIVIVTLALAGPSSAARQSPGLPGGAAEKTGTPPAGDFTLLYDAGSVVASAGDVNGDGYSDVIVGQPDVAGAGSLSGRASLFLGSADGLSKLAPWTIREADAGGDLGCAVACAGDVNADGYSDVLIGGRDGARVYLGSSTGLGTSAAWTVTSSQRHDGFGASLSSAGDVDGDGYGDVVIGADRHDAGELDEGAAFLYLGSASGLLSTPAWSAEGDQVGARFGRALAAADVNGDGFGDVLVGASGFDGGESDEGRVLVFLGSSAGLLATPAWAVESDQAGAAFGGALCTADVNGDGFGDVLVGASRFDAGETDEGRAFAFLGSAAGLATLPAWTGESNQAHARFGTALGRAGDRNGDGFDDVLVGANGFDVLDGDEGRVSFYRGSAAGLVAEPSWTIDGPRRGLRAGSSVAGAGDVNADGYADALVGAGPSTTTSSASERVMVVLGAGAMPEKPGSWSVTVDDGQSRFGSAVAIAGDVDGDGFDDVLVGHPGYEASPGFTPGRALLYRGSASGLEPTAAWTSVGVEPDQTFGQTLAGAGDVDGDGYGDVIIGAPQTDGTGVDGGRAYAYLGSPAGLATTAAWTVDGESGHLLASRLAGAGDVNGDGYADVLVASESLGRGRVRLYTGSPSGLGLEPAWSRVGANSFSGFGGAIAGVGDVDGDGLDDVLIGEQLQSYGHVHLFLGDESGLSDAPAWTLEGDPLPPRWDGPLGDSLGAGDYNGDGFADVAIQHQVRGLLVFHGSPSGLPSEPDWVFDFYAVLGLGQDVITASGDLDADGFSDLVATAMQERIVHAYRGGPAGLSHRASWRLLGDDPDASFGAAIASAGDVNGDGRADVVVGAPSSRYALPAAPNRVFAYLANRGGGAPLRAQQRRVGGAAPIAFHGVSNEDFGFELALTLERGFAGSAWASPFARTVRLEWEVEPSHGGSFDGVGIEQGALIPITGVPTSWTELLGGLAADTPLRWRARLRTNDPLVPVTPWFSLANNGRSQTKLRTAP